MDPIPSDRKGRERPPCWTPSVEIDGWAGSSAEGAFGPQAGPMSLLAEPRPGMRSPALCWGLGLLICESRPSHRAGARPYQTLITVNSIAEVFLTHLRKDIYTVLLLLDARFKIIAMGVPWQPSRLRTWHCPHCGLGSIPGPRTSACFRHGQKEMNSLKIKGVEFPSWLSRNKSD